MWNRHGRSPQAQPSSIWSRLARFSREMRVRSAGALRGLNQVHSADVIVAGPEAPAAPPRADALVTAAPGIGLAVLTADCQPVLFAEAVNDLQIILHGRAQTQLKMSARSKRHRHLIQLFRLTVRFHSSLSPILDASKIKQEIFRRV